jgi:hypothetical protein
MAQQYGGYGYYEYHRQFSFKAAQYLTQKGIKIDWSLRDQELYMSIFTGQKANCCAVCQSVSHNTPFCPQRSDSYVPQRPWQQSNSGNNQRKREYGNKTVGFTSSGQPICNNYNINN